MKSFEELKKKLLASKFFKDSFWAVFGNGIGNALLMLSGILIARFLGKDLYGEYGLVKTTMFYVAAFSTFGLGYTSTKWISEYKSVDETKVRSIAIDAMKISLISSATLALLLIIFAPLLASYIGEPSLSIAFRFLGIIIICRACSTTASGIMAGLGMFKTIAYNSMYAGLVMSCVCVPLTYFWGIKGALLSLSLSQIFNAFVNIISVKGELSKFLDQTRDFFTKRLLTFSFPVALQELSYTLCNWGSMLMLTKWSSLGEVGIYTASSQWNAIILFVPGLLSNVMLSHLSQDTYNQERHKKTVNMMLLVNLMCTLLPFIIFYILTPWIVTFYGQTFVGMKTVMRVLVFGTIFTCLSSVLSNELIALGKTWVLFCLRFIRDMSNLVGSYFVLHYFSTGEQALNIAWLNVLVGGTFFLLMYLIAKYESRFIKLL